MKTIAPKLLAAPNQRSLAICLAGLGNKLILSAQGGIFISRP